MVINAKIMNFISLSMLFCVSFNLCGLRKKHAVLQQRSKVEANIICTLSVSFVILIEVFLIMNSTF